MTQQPWGSAPNHWNRAPAPWGTPSGAPLSPPAQPFPQPQAPAQAYPPAYQNYPAPGSFPPPPPRRPRRSFFGSLVRTFVTIALIMFFVSLVRSVLAGFSEQWDAPTFPTTTAAPEQPGAPASTTTQPSVPGTYANDGYQAPKADPNPPDVPIPDTYKQAEGWLTANALYGQQVPAPTRCTMQPITGANTPAELEAKLNAQMACLMGVWEPPMKAAGFLMPRPPVTVYTSRVTTACGVMKEINAAYCAGDQQIYYSAKLLRALPPKVASTKYAAETVIAHEFGHAVQARTGILVADKALEDRASENEALDMSRRAEQQADCFGGLYVSSVAQSQGLSASDQKAIIGLNYYLGDDVLSGDASINSGHGSGKNRQAWFAKGMGTRSIGTCNTWTVPSSAVR